MNVYAWETERAQQEKNAVDAARWMFADLPTPLLLVVDRDLSV